MEPSAEALLPNPTGPNGMKLRTPARRLKCLPTKRTEVYGPPVAMFSLPMTPTTKSTTERPVRQPAPSANEAQHPFWTQHPRVALHQQVQRVLRSRLAFRAKKLSQEVGRAQIRNICRLRPQANDQANLATPNRHLEGAHIHYKLCILTHLGR